LLDHSIVSQHFMEPEGSLQHLQDLHTCSLARPIQSTSQHSNSKRSILILSTHLRLGLPSGLFPSGFPINNLRSSSPPFVLHTCPAHLILPDLIIAIISYFAKVRLRGLVVRVLAYRCRGPSSITGTTTFSEM
jgi:hypothetical protein